MPTGLHARLILRLQLLNLNVEGIKIMLFPLLSFLLLVTTVRKEKKKKREKKKKVDALSLWGVAQHQVGGG